MELFFSTSATCQLTYNRKRAFTGIYQCQRDVIMKYFLSAVIRYFVRIVVIVRLLIFW